MASKRVLLAVAGSRGDAQPYVGLGTSLQEAGFAVHVLTQPDHVPLFQQAGISVWSYGDFSVEKALRENENLRESMAKGDAFKFIKALGKIMKEYGPASFPHSLQQIRDFKPDVIVYMPLASWDTPAIAHAWGIPCVLSSLQSIAPTGYKTSLWGEPEWFPKRAHLALQMLIYAMRARVYMGSRPLVKKHCPEAVPWLASLSQHMLVNLFHTPARPLILTSPLLNSWQPDWPVGYDPLYTGAPVVRPEKQVEYMEAGSANFGGGEKERLETFLRAGRPPVYMGWGSMVSVSPEHMAQLAVRTLMRVGERGIILGGIAQLKEEMLEGQADTKEMRAYVDANVLFVQAAPHEMLFPHCSAIVHHGGAGTTYAALRSGAPSVITPVWLDQFPNGAILQGTGAGLRLKHFGKVTVQDLSAAVTRCLTDEAMRAKARSLAAQLHDEDGAATATRELKRFLAEDVASGKYAAKLAERKQQMEILARRGNPSCFAWLGRVFCSSEPNNFWVPLPGKDQSA